MPLLPPQQFDAHAGRVGETHHLAAARFGVVFHLGVDQRRHRLQVGQRGGHQAEAQRDGVFGAFRGMHERRAAGGAHVQGLLAAVRHRQAEID